MKRILFIILALLSLNTLSAQRYITRGDSLLSFTDTDAVVIDVPHVKYIVDTAFWRCKSTLKQIIIPSTVVSMGGAAGDVITGVFYEHTKLETVTIGTGIQFLGTKTFAGCTSLKNLYIQSLIPPDIISSTIFDGVPEESVTLYVPKNHKAPYALRFANQPAIKEIVDNIEEVTDTVTVYVLDTLRDTIEVHDTIQGDTIIQHDTVWGDPVEVHDTLRDTTLVAYDTVQVDSTVYDTITWIKDTIHDTLTQIHDSLIHVHDTVINLQEVHDTLHIHDTIYLTDTVYLTNTITDTVYVVLDDGTNTEYVAEEIKVIEYTDGGVILTGISQNYEFAIYTVSGKLVYKGRQNLVDLPKLNLVYILVQNGKAYKFKY